MNVIMQEVSRVTSSKEGKDGAGFKGENSRVYKRLSKRYQCHLWHELRESALYLVPKNADEVFLHYDCTTEQTASTLSVVVACWRGVTLSQQMIGASGYLFVQGDPCT